MVRVDNMVVRIDNMVVRIDNMVVRIDNLVVRIDNMVVRIDNLVVRIDNMMVRVDNMVVRVVNMVVRVDNMVLRVDNMVVRVDNMVVRVDNMVVRVDNMMVHCVFVYRSVLHGHVSVLLCQVLQCIRYHKSAIISIISIQVILTSSILNHKYLIRSSTSPSFTNYSSSNQPNPPHTSSFSRCKSFSCQIL